MSEAPQVDWGDLEALAEKPNKPRWPFCCGGCCLLVVIGMVGLMFFTARSIKRLQDPEVSWPALAEVLEYDRQPEGFRLEGGGPLPLMGGVEGFWFDEALEIREGETVRNPLRIYLMVFPPDEPELERIFLRPSKGSFENQREVTMTVQGRELEGLSRVQDQAAPNLVPVRTRGAILELRIPEAEDPPHSGPGSKPIVVFFTRPGSEVSIQEEEVRRFLSSFHVGPDR